MEAKKISMVVEEDRLKGIVLAGKPSTEELCTAAVTALSMALIQAGNEGYVPYERECLIRSVVNRAMEAGTKCLNFSEMGFKLMTGERRSA